MNKVPTIVAAATLALGLALGAKAERAQAQSNPNSATSASSSDATFVKNAAQGGMAEVKLGQLAEEKGTNQAVKDFGKRMVDDHSRADDQLKETASRTNIALPADVSKHDQSMYEELSRLSGQQFDMAYARAMVRDHEKDVAEFKKEATNGQNDDVKSFAAQTLTTLDDHLTQARQMLQTVSSAASATRSNGAQ